MRILITGGAGFIGSNFIHFILNNYPDDQIICVDSLTYAGNLSNIEKALEDSRFVFIHTNISDSTSIGKIFRKYSIDIVVNFAAESHVDRSVLYPNVFLSTNIIGTHVLLEACKKYGIKRFHQISTDEVYGDLPLNRKDLLFTEDSPIKASSPYSASKAAADLLTLAYHRTFGTPVTISRCSNNYGKFHFPEKLIPLVITKAINDDTIPVYGTGENVRDWIYVEDHCEAIDNIIRNGKVGEIYNIGGNTERTNLEVVHEILSILNKPLSLISFVNDRPGHDLRYAINSTKMKKELGWVPKIKFNEGLRNTVNWYLENKKWWQDIINGNYKKDYELLYKDKLKRR